MGKVKDIIINDLHLCEKRKVYNYESYKVVPVSHNLVDFFWGFGWNNWARFKWDTKTSQWELWKKTTHLPKDFILTLERYRKEK